MMRRLFKVVLPLAIVVAAALGAGFLWATRPQVETRTPEERVWTVAAVTVARGDVQPVMRLYGEIVAGREVELRPLVGGSVVEVGENFVDGGILRQ